MNMFVCILLQCAGGWAGKGEVKYAMEFYITCCNVYYLTASMCSTCF